MLLKVTALGFIFIALSTSQVLSAEEYDDSAYWSVGDEEQLSTESESDSSSTEIEVHALSDDMISRINRVQKNWTVSLLQYTVLGSIFIFHLITF